MDRGQILFFLCLVLISSSIAANPLKGYYRDDIILNIDGDFGRDTIVIGDTLYVFTEQLSGGNSFLIVSAYDVSLGDSLTQIGYTNVTSNDTIVFSYGLSYLDNNHVLKSGSRMFTFDISDYQNVFVSKSFDVDAVLADSILTYLDGNGSIFSVSYPSRYMYLLNYSNISNPSSKRYDTLFSDVVPKIQDMRHNRLIYINTSSNRNLVVLNHSNFNSISIEATSKNNESDGVDFMVDSDGLIYELQSAGDDFLVWEIIGDDIIMKKNVTISVLETSWDSLSEKLISNDFNPDYPIVMHSDGTLFMLNITDVNNIESIATYFHINLTYTGNNLSTVRRHEYGSDGQYLYLHTDRFISAISLDPIEWLNSYPDFNVSTSDNTPQLGQIVNINVSAFDEDGDTIYYAFDCAYPSISPVYDSVSNVNCSYNTTGNRNIAIYVGDDGARHGLLDFNNRQLVSISIPVSGGGGKPLPIEGYCGDTLCRGLEDDTSCPSDCGYFEEPFIEIDETAKNLTPTFMIDRKDWYIIEPSGATFIDDLRIKNLVRNTTLPLRFSFNQNKSSITGISWVSFKFTSGYFKEIYSVNLPPSRLFAVYRYIPFRIEIPEDAERTKHLIVYDVVDRSTGYTTQVKFLINTGDDYIWNRFRYLLMKKLIDWTIEWCEDFDAIMSGEPCPEESMMSYRFIVRVSDVLVLSMIVGFIFWSYKNREKLPKIRRPKKRDVRPWEEKDRL